MITSAGGFYVWDRYFSEMGKARRFAEEQTATLEKAETAYVKAMTEDTYGGKTPQETLDLFVDALKKGDVELASKYFALNDNENSEFYLTRREYEVALYQVKLDGKLAELISVISMAKFDSKSDVFNTVSYVVYGTNGELMADISLWFNKTSRVWKIESL